MPGGKDIRERSMSESTGLFGAFLFFITISSFCFVFLSSMGLSCFFLNFLFVLLCFVPIAF